MKQVLFLLCFFLCLSVAIAEPDRLVGVAKRQVTKDGMEVWDIIDTAGTSYRFFGMKNRREDSAWCKISYKPKNPSSKKLIEKELEGGEIRRRDVFEKDTAFEKIIDDTKIGEAFRIDPKSNYVDAKIDKCTLCVKHNVQSVQEQALEEDGQSFQVPTQISKRVEPKKKVEDEYVAKTGIKEVIESNAVNDNRKPSIKDLLLWVSLFINGVIVLVLIYRLLFQERRHLKQVEAYFGDGNDNAENVTEKDKKIAELEKQCEEQTIKIGKLNETIRQLNERISRSESCSETCVPESGESDSLFADVAAVVPSPVRKVKFYFSNPNGNKFNASKSTDVFVEDKSLYCFERVIGENNAEVVVVDVPSVVQRFTYSPEPQMGVCELVGSYIKDASSIGTVESGIAVLEGDKWMIKKKIKIRYI